MIRGLFFVAAAAAALHAGQAEKKAVLENAGKPMRVPFQCSEDDIQSFGLTCSAEDPCAVYFEAAGVEFSGPRMFVTGNLHTSTTTLYSILLASEDGGKSWTEPVERIRSAGLEGIQFFDFEVGWIGGQLLQATPRDPFFLLTSDGGKTWRRRPVFGESRVGAIEHFRFDSRSAGTLIIDRMQSGEGGRHEKYETMTGGESWMLRVVSSKPIAVRKPAPEEASRRLRADAASKAFRLERREGGRWAALASFLVDAGTCRPAERALPEPPPEPEPAVEQPPAGVKPAPAKRRAPSLRRPDR